MHRFRFRIAAVAAVILAIVAAAPVAAGQLKLDRAWGSGVRFQIDPSSTPPTFDFNASSNPDGSSPAGSFIFKLITSEFTGTVECLDVHGNTATIVGLVSTAVGGYDGTQGQIYVAVVQDNGVATKRHPSPDTMSGVTAGITGTTVAAVCADPYTYTGTAMLSLVSGDITVIDR